jgi:hypothetical protein
MDFVPDLIILNMGDMVAFRKAIDELASSSRG